MWQLVVVAIVLIGAVGYAVRRIYINFKKANDPCYGCTGCALKDIKDKKNCEKGCCSHKK
jgi:hypothetical protein